MVGDIKNMEFNSDGSKITMELESQEHRSKMFITCMYVDSGNEVLIGIFDLALFIGENNINFNYSVWYLYKLRKDTTYQFSEYQLLFKIDIDTVNYLEITLSSLTIKFKDFAQSCEFINDQLENVQAELNKAVLVTPCKSDDEKWAFEEYNLESFTGRSKPINEETEKEETEQEGKLEEDTEEEVRPRKTIFIICMIVALVLISILGIIILLYCVKIRKTQNVQDWK
ncbi:hypothetical protein RF11_07598 [Thelohanellus kitauei]|uniref:Uncharacterized protein n=1 Tax=Thelohanellus kitauei TaxID=669202 RepID=A0A0C2IRJ8_THEKT|nr:hypothetical protein RF11_07598 [Thelohanellus kitauei]